MDKLYVFAHLLIYSVQINDVQTKRNIQAEFWNTKFKNHVISNSNHLAVVKIGSYVNVSFTNCTFLTTKLLQFVPYRLVILELPRLTLPCFFQVLTEGQGEALSTIAVNFINNTAGIAGNSCMEVILMVAKVFMDLILVV